MCAQLELAGASLARSVDGIQVGEGAGSGSVLCAVGVGSEAGVRDERMRVAFREACGVGPASRDWFGDVRLRVRRRDVRDMISQKE